MSMKLTLNDVDKYCYEKEIEVSQNTIRTYKNILYNFIKYCGNNTDYHTNYIRYLHEKQDTTQNYQYLLSVVIRKFFEYMKVPNTNNLPIPKRDKKIKQALTKEELHELQEACLNDFEYNVIYILSHTGLRLTEFLNLKFKDINPGQKTLIVQRGKGSKQRKIPLTNKTIEIINECQIHPKQVYVFEHYYQCEQHHPYSTKYIQELVKTVAGRTSITKNVSPHVLRHTFATNCIRGGLNVTYLQRILGHSSLNTTQVYVNLEDNEVQDAFEQIIE